MSAVVPVLLTALLASGCTSDGRDAEPVAQAAPEAVTLSEQMRSLFNRESATVPSEGFLLARSGAGSTAAEIIGVDLDGKTCLITRHDGGRLGGNCLAGLLRDDQVGFQQSNAQAAPGWGFFAVSLPEGAAEARLESDGVPALTAEAGEPWRGRSYAVGYWPKPARATLVSAMDESGQPLIDRQPATGVK